MAARADVSTPQGTFAPLAPPVVPPQEAQPGSDGHRPIGATGDAVRVLSFSGGLFDAAMQLGTVHALLVTAAKPPDVIAGISTGAINAVAAAEILQAGDDLEDPQLRM